MSGAIAIGASTMPAPHILTIKDMGSRGEGVAEVDGQRIFVPFTLPGETVAATIDGNRATAHQIKTPSPERTEPFCPHFGSCGGCQLQHWNRSAYQTWKKDLLVSALSKVGLETDVRQLVDAQGDGRRRVTMHGRKDGAGFMGLRSNIVHNLDTCPILVPALKPAGDITRACYRAIGDCEVSITATLTGLDVSIRAKRKPDYKALTNIAAKFKLARLSMNNEDIIVARPPEIQMGPARIRLPVGSFLQATEAAETIIGERLTAACTDAKRVADLFCGVGPFALRLAQHAKTLAVDSDKRAIAVCDTALRGTPGLKTIGAEARDLMRDPMTSAELKPFDAVVFDPPRAGAEAQAHEMAASKVKTIVAVSCDPHTFARDARILVDGGYKLESATPIDQFNWSAHLETVAVFRR